MKIPCEDWKHVNDENQPVSTAWGMGGFRQMTCKICGYLWREDGCGLYETIMPDGRTLYKETIMPDGRWQNTIQKGRNMIFGSWVVHFKKIYPLDFTTNFF